MPLNPGVAKKAQIAGLSAAGLTVVGVGGYLLYRTLKPVGDAAADAAGIVSDFTGSVGAIVGTGTKIIDDFSAGTTKAFDPPSLADYRVILLNQLPLTLTLLSNVNRNTRDYKRNTSTFQVTTPDGAPQVNARVTGIRVNRVIASRLSGYGGNYTKTGYTGTDGRVVIVTEVRNVGVGIESEDDYDFVANHPGYNTSAPVRVT